jgi:glycogen operon protein
LLFHFILNAYFEPLEFELPELARGTWGRWIDTGLESPEDIVPWDQTKPVPGKTYRAAAHSVALLFARIEATSP